MSEVKYKHRKFYKIYGISSIFNFVRSSGNNYGYYDLTQLKTTMDDRIDEHTILFITANADDNSTSALKRKIKVYDGIGTNGTINVVEHEIHDCDTFIWARGAAYCISTKGVYDVSSNGNVLTFLFSDGTSKSVTVSIGGQYTAGDNIKIENDVISATGYSQISEIFKISNDRKLYAEDVYAGNNETNPTYKLSHIHSILEADWYDIPVGELNGSFDKLSFDDSFDK